MCRFFSVLADDRANIYYHDKEIRTLIRSGKSNLREDSHASIAEYHFKDSKKEDNYFKFEYNVFTNILKYDGAPSMKPSSEFIDRVHGKINLLDFKEIEPLLSIKPIECPFLYKHIENMSDEIKKLCMDAYSTSGLVRDSVRDSVIELTFDSVTSSVWNSVMGSVRDLVFDSVMDLVKNSVMGSVFDSVMDSVVSYCCTFYPFLSYIDNSFHLKLWEMGIIPVFHKNTCYVVASNGVIGQFSTKEVPNNEQV